MPADNEEARRMSEGRRARQRLEEDTLRAGYGENRDERLRVEGGGEISALAPMLFEPQLGRDDLPIQ